MQLCQTDAQMLLNFALQNLKNVKEFYETIIMRE
jgi:hypothetical protein